MDMEMETPEGFWSLPEEIASLIERRFQSVGELRKVASFPPWLQVVELRKMYSIPDNRT